MASRFAAALWAIVAVACLASGSALGARSSLAGASEWQVPAQATSNWAGYVATASATAFTSVTATWTQPRAECGASTNGAAASFWVGLGGADPPQQALEQAGTVSQCNPSGSTTYRAWYQIVPGSAVTVGLRVAPGDLMTASVNVVANGTQAIFQIKNRTTRHSYTAEVALANAPDLSSADWIVEAPTHCAGIVCLPVPLQGFGSVAFSRVAALGNGIGGTLTHYAWVPHRLELVPTTVLASGPSIVGANAGAATTDLTPEGNSFDVLWSESATNLPGGL